MPKHYGMKKKDKMSKLEKVEFENKNLKWDLDKVKNERDSWVKLTILFIFIWLVTAIFY